MSTPRTIIQRFPTADVQENSPEAMLERLGAFQPQGAPVISLYLDARVNENGKRNFAPFVRKRMAEVIKNVRPCARTGARAKNRLRCATASRNAQTMTAGVAPTGLLCRS